jgi:prophage regulatory protein
MVTAMTSHLVGLSEIAAMLGVSRQRVGQLARDYDDFPAPVAELASGRIWERTSVEAWANAHPVRPPGRPSTDFAREEEV